MTSPLVQAASAVGFVGDILEDVRLEGQTVSFVVVLNEQEQARRQVNGLGPILDRDLLAALGTLPLGHPIGWASIDPVLWPTLDTAPAGVLSLTGSGATRLWQPALSIEGVMGLSSSWRTGLRLGVFNPDAPTAVVLQEAPRRLFDALREASRLGVGLVLARREGNVEVLLKPRPRSPRQNVRHWRFKEQVYRAWLRRQINPAQART